MYRHHYRVKYSTSTVLPGKEQEMMKSRREKKYKGYIKKPHQDQYYINMGTNKELNVKNCFISASNSNTTHYVTISSLYIRIKLHLWTITSAHGNLCAAYIRFVRVRH